MERINNTTTVFLGASPWRVHVEWTSFHFYGGKDLVNLPKLSLLESRDMNSHRLVLGNLHPNLTETQLINAADVLMEEFIKTATSLREEQKTDPSQQGQVSDEDYTKYKNSVQHACVISHGMTGLYTRFGWLDFATPQAAAFFYVRWKNMNGYTRGWKKRQFPFANVHINFDRMTGWLPQFCGFCGGRPEADNEEGWMCSQCCFTVAALNREAAEASAETAAAAAAGLPAAAAAASAGGDDYW